MKVKKMPTELDTENVYNALYKMIYDFAESAKQALYNSELTSEQKCTCIKHLYSKACGVYEVITKLGYEIYSDNGLRNEREMLNSLFAYEQSAKIELMRNKEKEQ